MYNKSFPNLFFGMASKLNLWVKKVDSRNQSWRTNNGVERLKQLSYIFFSLYFSCYDMIVISSCSATFRFQEKNPCHVLFIRIPLLLTLRLYNPVILAEKKNRTQQTVLHSPIPQSSVIFQCFNRKNIFIRNILTRG